MTQNRGNTKRTYDRQNSHYTPIRIPNALYEKMVARLDRQCIRPETMSEYIILVLEHEVTRKHYRTAEKK